MKCKFQDSVAGFFIVNPVLIYQILLKDFYRLNTQVLTLRFFQPLQFVLTIWTDIRFKNRFGKYTTNCFICKALKNDFYGNF